MSRAAAVALLALCGCLESPPGEAADGGTIAGDGSTGCDGACCPASQLIETFEGEPSGSFLTESTDDGCVVIEELGAVWLSNSAVGESCDYETALLWRLTGESASIEIAVPGDGAPNLEFRTELGTGDKFFFERSPDGMRVAQQPSGLPPETLIQSVFQPSLHRYWRLSADPAGEILTFEVAGPDLEWDPLWQVAVPAGSTDCVELELATRGLVGDDGDDRVAFDNLNTQ